MIINSIIKTGGGIEKGIIVTADTGGTNPKPTAVQVVGYTAIPEFMFGTQAASSAATAYRYVRTFNLSDEITHINLQAFRGCEYWCETALPSSLNTIGASAFEACSALAISVIPSGITVIPSMAFSACLGITTLNMPCVSSIAYRGFYYCPNLVSVTIGSQGHPVSSIVPSTFERCTNLASITVYTNGGAALSGQPWGATSATVSYLSA